MTGDTLFSLRVPATVPFTTYGELLSVYKLKHNATIVAVGDDAYGKGLALNATAPTSRQVRPDQMIYYIAEERIAQGAIELPATDHATFKRRWRW